MTARLNHRVKSYGKVNNYGVTKEVNKIKRVFLRLFSLFKCITWCYSQEFTISAKWQRGNAWRILRVLQVGPVKTINIPVSRYSVIETKGVSTNIYLIQPLFVVTIPDINITITTTSGESTIAAVNMDMVVNQRTFKIKSAVRN